MPPHSSMSAEQRLTAVDLFEQGFGYVAVSSRLGVSRHAIEALQKRFKIWGRAALESKPTKQVYSFEFKLALVRQVLDGEGTLPDLARMNQLSSPKLLGKWVQAYRIHGEDGLRPKAKGRPLTETSPEPVELTELEKLRRENQRLAAENAYLKSTGLEEPNTAVKASAVIALKASHPLPLLLAATGLPRSTFFHRQAALKAPDRHADLRSQIHEIFTDAKGRYGHRRIHAALTRRGYAVGKKTVLKLMRQENLVCKIRTRRRYSSYKGTVGKIVEILLKREFEAKAPNTKWVTDATEFKIANSKVYLSPVLDLFDRSIISYAASESPNTAFTNKSLSEAIGTLAAGEAPLMHSDQGFQYQHASWQKLLSKANMPQIHVAQGQCPG